MAKKESAEATVRNIRRNTRKKYGAEEKIRIVLEGLKGESTIAPAEHRDTVNCVDAQGLPKVCTINPLKGTGVVQGILRSRKTTVVWEHETPGR